jgi:hypothetical protein
MIRISIIIWNMVSSLHPFGSSILPIHMISWMLNFLSDEAILEAMTMNGRPWEDMHHIFLFLPKLETLQVDYQRNPLA